MVQLEEVTKLKEKRITDEQQKQENINQIFKEKLEKAEQAKLAQLEEISKLKEKRIIDEQQEKERLVSVGWGLQKTGYPARIILEAVDRVGLLSDITSLVSAERVNIGYCVSEEVGANSVVSLTVYTTGIEQLNTLFVKLEGVKGVLSVNRST